MTNSLWTLADVAAYFQVSAASTERIAASSASFPPPVILPSTGRGERQIKRWIPADVTAWAESQKRAA